MNEFVVLVDENDHALGEMEKMEVHEKGLLHRAVSVLVFNANNELLLQQRALGKYHSGGLWTNTCCSHPRPEERTVVAAERRLIEEMGMELKLDFAFSFIYAANLDNDLTENELDHVFIGRSDETPHINTEEAMAFQWKSIEKIKSEMEINPEKYTAWFRILILEHYEQILKAIQS
ncbi:MAG: hypothetical protein RL264_729 [Bacteroidota bacterium]|jgi:isopentenyl-diphosphate delta-isomerase